MTPGHGVGDGANFHAPARRAKPRLASSNCCPSFLRALRDLEPVLTQAAASRLRQDGRTQRAIFFGGAEEPLPEPPWDVAFRISSDEYQGEIRLQMQVEALRASVSDAQ